MYAPHLWLVVALVASHAQFAAAAEPARPIPHGQSKAPGPALSPEQAIAAMKVPEGFHVELVAAEPDLVNPVAMTFDERGRIWITESLEYPRKEAGPGRDRIKVLEDTDGDGRADKCTVFAEGLNIPSGIAVGAGGVWVANSPDILFLQDTDGDGRADKREVVVTGFGRRDTHELPNSLTWGPDGWLYGLNGVFNNSHVEQHGKTFDFTVAMFRIHPRTRDFELFAEGTSNPWGIAWDGEGSAFISACVIDHLWHLTESGYYHRQAGAYPPFTWKIESIVRHQHQQAAYCGIHYFDSEAYPPEYRGRLYMGNIHGNCINSDRLARDGSTYLGTPEADFLSANDAWFMPVAQKTGPDGCLYVLDWYDRYHCYQDAGRDPKGIDRLKGRLYRVRYKDSPRAAKFDRAQESDDHLIERLHSANVYDRDIAQRLLWERNAPAARAKLERLVLDSSAPRKARMHALWALVACGPLDAAFHGKLLELDDASFRAWGVRAAGNTHQISPTLRETITKLAKDLSPDVRLQVAVASTKIEGLDAIPVLVDVLAASGDDKLIPQIVWMHLHPLLEERAADFVAAARRTDPRQTANIAKLYPRVVERLIARASSDFAPLAAVVEQLTAEKSADPALAGQCLAVVATKVQAHELQGDKLAALRTALGPTLAKVRKAGNDGPLFLDVALLSASWGDAAGHAAAREVLNSTKHADSRRLQAFEALVAADKSSAAADNASVLDAVGRLLATPAEASLELRRRMLAALSTLEEPRVAEVVLAAYARLEPDLKPQAIELLSDRASWSKMLVAAVSRREVDAAALNVNQIRKLQASSDAELKMQVATIWGTVRTERNPQREQVIAQVRDLVRRKPGNPNVGQVVFQKVCGQCHKIHGQGQEVGPDITVNGRSSYEQLLSNVLDPSLVIGATYQARTVATKDGRIVTGLLAEDSPQRVVLKVQGGKLETIARSEVDRMETSKLSLMPEDLEKQLKPEELADLFAFLTLDKPPTDPEARQLPGVRPAADK